jgi:dTMP kinase
VVGRFRPDLTIVLDLPVAIGLARSGRRLNAAESQEDRYERMDKAFHERVRQGFLDIAEREPERCAIVDATRNPDEVFADIRALVGQRLELELGHG